MFLMMALAANQSASFSTGSMSTCYRCKTNFLMATMTYKSNTQALRICQKRVRHRHSCSVFSPQFSHCTIRSVLHFSRQPKKPKLLTVKFAAHECMADVTQILPTNYVLHSCTKRVYFNL